MTTCRDAVNEMALHFLAKMKILVVQNIERNDVEFVSRVRFLADLFIFFTQWNLSNPNTWIKDALK